MAATPSPSSPPRSKNTTTTPEEAVHAPGQATLRRRAAGERRGIDSRDSGQGAAPAAGAEPDLEGAALLPRDGALHQWPFPAILGGIWRAGDLRLSPDEALRGTAARQPDADRAIFRARALRVRPEQRAALRRAADADRHGDHDAAPG